MDNIEYIEISKNKIDRVYLSASEFRNDFEPLFQEYRTTYKDARIKDLAQECIIHYKTCLSNVIHIDDFSTGINNVEAVVKGENIIKEIQIYINNTRAYKNIIVSRMNDNYDPTLYEIDHVKRKGLRITFKVIIEFLESIINSKTQKVKITQATKHQDIFTADGEQLFNFLNEMYVRDDKTLKSKYSWLYHFLKNGQIRCSQLKYIAFIKTTFGIKLSRIQDIQYKYKNIIEPLLNDLKTEFEENRVDKQ